MKTMPFQFPLGIALCLGLGGQESPALAEEQVTAEMLRVLPVVESGPRITPFLRFQLDRAWKQDEGRRQRFAAIRTEAELLELQRDLRARSLRIMGGLPTERTPLNPQVTGTIVREGYVIEKVVFESLPGLHVTALLYRPTTRPAGRLPAVLLACGHAPLGKAHPAYQEIAMRLVKRGYVVFCWDPVGQGERSQFWDAIGQRSRYNLVCGEHAVLGNLATLAGTSLVRFMVWDGMRALDYLLTRPEVDGSRIAITGTSGGGFQSLWIGALDERIRVVMPSCFVTSLPMRMANRIFEDPDSDPEQDPPGLVSEGVDHAGLLLLAYPRAVHVAAAVKDFFPIEGTRKTVREVERLYEAFGHGDRFALSEGFHGHQYSVENQKAAFGFLDRANDRPAAEVAEVAEPDGVLGADALRCTRSGQVRVDLAGRSLTDLIRDVGRGQPKTVDVSALYREGYPRIRDWPVVPFRGGAARNQIAWVAVGRSEVGRIVIDRYVLHHSGPLLMPLVHIYSKDGSAGRVVLRTSLQGKVGVEGWPAVQADLRRGDQVVSFDARGLGETRLHYRAESIDDPQLASSDEAAAYASPVSGVFANHVYNALLTGRPYFLELIEDTEIAARFARVKLGAKRLALSGGGDVGPLADAVVQALPEIELVPSPPSGPGFSWAETVEQMKEVWPIHFLLPGGAFVQPRPAQGGPR